MGRKEWIWVGSQALDIEIDRLPGFEQQSRLRQVVEFVSLSIPVEEKEIERANELQKMGFIGFDAIHLACAESGEADIFLTTDDRLLKLARGVAKKIKIKVENPLDWMKEMI